MGNVCCTNNRSIHAKVSRRNSTLSQVPSMPPAPRHELQLQFPHDDTDWKGMSILDFIDEGGSPAVDLTKSQESVREWMGDLEESADDVTFISADIEDTKPNDPNIMLASMVILAPASYYDAEEEATRPKRRIVSSMQLETPKLPFKHNATRIFS
eukprot:TRINITY_DN12814_c0_g1_i6.p1 TRINITY_DN12814_c0_g1~~TRINITY_DN12814_c0_g1_i6.p1  ORF type:complete len:155 (+),score=32.40 TRINITY_DN12814_c0_g1_i6:74-538(+)